VESISKWRSTLIKEFEIKDKSITAIPFIYEKQNYINKVKLLILDAT